MRNLRALSILCLTLLALPARSFAANSAPPPHLAAAEARLREFVEKRHLPGLAVAVGSRGQTVWQWQTGVANLETREPITAESVFPIGSTSKVLTALVLGQLVEEQKIDLDAAIQRYVPSFPLKEHTITPRQLAGHLSGLRDYDMAAGEYHNQRHFESVLAAVEVFAHDALRFEPGTRHAYSAYNFVLLSAAMQGATGEDFLTLMERRLFRPQGLVHTGPSRTEVPGLVKSYTAGFLGAPLAAPVTDASNKWAAGGFVSTPHDLVRLGLAVLAGKVVSRETFNLLATPQRLKDGSDSGAGYGMGLRSGLRMLPKTGREVRVVHHGGTGSGSMSFLVLFPEEELVISMQSNLLFSPFDDFAAEVYALADLFLASRP